jgi:hypothetical protein
MKRLWTKLYGQQLLSYLTASDKLAYTLEMDSAGSDTVGGDVLINALGD